MKVGKKFFREAQVNNIKNKKGDLIQIQQTLKN